MTGLKDQEKLTDGKGWKGVDFSREMPYKAIQDAVTTVKKAREKIQKIKDKKKRGPRDE